MLQSSRALRQGVHWLARGSLEALPVAQHVIQSTTQLLTGGATCSLPGHFSSASVQPARSVNSYGFAATSIPTYQPFPGSDEMCTVRIATGNLRGAGTQSHAFIQFIGSNGRSDRVMLDVEHSGTFDRGSVRTFRVPIPKHIGKLHHVRVEKTSENLLGEGWFLQHVEVETPRGERVLFPCNAWLGESDCGGYNGGSRTAQLFNAALCCLPHACCS